MYPPCNDNSCETTNLVIPAALCLSQGCTICVDTLHHLCRYPTSFVQIPYIICVWCVLRDLFLKAYYIHAMYPLCHIKLFQRLILFGIMFLIKGGIYTNNVPPFAAKILAKQPIWSFPLHCACPRGARFVQIPYIICVDTLHHLCRMCFERPLFKGILYS